MNMFVIVIGFIELILSLLLCVFILFITFKFLHFINKKIDDIKELKNNNYSVALYNASILFSVTWVAKSSIRSAVSSLTLLLRNPNAIFSDVLKTAGVISLQIIISLSIAFAGVYFGMLLFTKLTKNIDEFTLIKNNNIAIAIIVSTIIIIIALFIEPSVKTIVQGLIPYPSIIGNPS